MLDLTFSQPQIRNTVEGVEYHFVVGLQLRIASKVKPVLKVKFTFVLAFKSQVGFWTLRISPKIKPDSNTALWFNFEACSNVVTPNFSANLKIWILALNL